MAAIPAESSVASAGPALPPKIVPIQPRRQKRLRLLDAVIEAGCEVIAHGATALRSLVESRVHDARADAHVREIDRIAARMAAEACELGDTVTFNRAAAIRRHCAGYAQWRRRGRRADRRGPHGDRQAVLDRARRQPHADAGVGEAERIGAMNAAQQPADDARGDGGQTPSLFDGLQFAHEVMEYAQSVGCFGYCECMDCKECGKPVDDCSGTECARTCQCGHCLACRADMAIEGAKAALDAAASPAADDDGRAP